MRKFGVRKLGRFPMIYYPLFGFLVWNATFKEVEGIEISMFFGITSLVFVIGAFIAYCIHKYSKNDKISFIHRVLFGISFLSLAIGVITGF